ncbi:MAG: undecaprenyl/decaprenyl-phosphate alpha-N-acetylglucosaminyl 1-phosphate transferase [Candidatus Magasanikbacteria bacterium]|nr:undecaprenyl/decaprenyl-phosphate alpha-N-acetylglucosaminyl 1-phosphate transferase [Candidatus Magasanikbacteria bacterium]
MIYFFIAAAFSFLLTLVVKKFAQKLQIVDRPNEERKQHANAVPLLGGSAIFVSFWCIVFYLYNYSGIIFKHLNARQLVLFFLAGLIIMVVGYYDDKFKIVYHYRLLFSALSVLLVLAGGLNFDGITNPFGGTIGLDFWKIHTQYFGTILVGVEIIAFLWLMGMIYTVKILDGLDGLATGVVMIGALAVTALSGGSTKFLQPDVSLVALVLAGSCLGFLFFNFFPAKIFLGEGGGQFLGLMLGAIAIIAGSKIATALLVMAVPIIDLIYVIIGRLKNHQSISEGDRRHLHFRLVDSGFKQWQAVSIFYLFAALFGISALFMTSIWKLMTLLSLIFVVIILETVVSRQQLYGKK